MKLHTDIGITFSTDDCDDPVIEFTPQEFPRAWGEERTLDNYVTLRYHGSEYMVRLFEDKDGIVCMTINGRMRESYHNETVIELQEEK